MPPSGSCNMAEAAAAFPKKEPSAVLRAGKAAKEPARTAMAAAVPNSRRNLPERLTQFPP